VAQLEEIRSETQRIDSANTIHSNKVMAKLEEIQSLVNAAPNIITINADTNVTAAQISSVVEQSRVTEADLSILYSLRFPAINARHLSIHGTYKQTFEWIYKQEFNTWLESGDGVFWISGKPGSGKSTLCKFLASEQRTKKALQIWSGDKELFTPAYFFWNAGTDLQKSITGLLRTILYEILRRCPHLISQVFAERWQQTHHTGKVEDVWNDAELVVALKETLNHELSNCFCLFIDGLDELVGDHRELVQLLLDMTSSGEVKSTNIKICLSSRPWPIFEEAFAYDPSRMIRLHDLTYQDIKTYVSNKLEEHSQFRTLKKFDAPYQLLVEDVTRRADGVFLWVYLVVTELCVGLTNADTIADLRERFHRLPTDLGSYFRHILGSFEGLYQARAARTLLLCMNAAGWVPICYLALFYDHEVQLLDSTSDTLWEDLQFEDWSLDKHMEWLKSSVIRMNASCRGLVEIRSNGRSFQKSSRVDFLHRTVKDYLRAPAMQKFLQERAGPRFEPFSILFQLSRGVLQLYGKSSSELEMCMSYLWQWQQKLGLSTASRDALCDTVGTEFYEILCYHKHAEEAGTSSYGRCQSVSNILELDPHILFLVVRYGLLSFLKLVQDSPSVKDNLERLLYGALESQILYREEVIRFLLQIGANPNKLGERSGTLWESFLLLIRGNWEFVLPSGRDNYRTTAKLLLNHGVDLNLIIPATDQSVPISAKDFVLDIVGCKKEDLKNSLNWKKPESETSPGNQTAEGVDNSPEQTPDSEGHTNQDKSKAALTRKESVKGGKKPSLTRRIPHLLSGKWKTVKGKYSGEE
jgi:hypothetical protein